MTTQACGLCGRDPATGYALVGDTRYCHGDGDPDPTCYMRAQWKLIEGPHNWACADDVLDPVRIWPEGVSEGKR